MYLKSKQFLPVSIDEAWDFFIKPENLQKLTPEDMNFRITSYSLKSGIYPGMIITYKVNPILNIKMNWMTEISHLKEKEYFVDDQKLGPFKVWHHQHHFLEVKGGVEMTDIIYYSVGYGFIGRFIERLLVNRRIRNIFEYRRIELEKLFVHNNQL